MVTWEEATQAASAALVEWADFPVTVTPRPLVLTSYPRVFRGGFRSGDAKLAFLDGAIDTHVPLPEGVLDLLGARQTATSQLRLQVLDAQSSIGVFDTDRGPTELPAWQLTLTDVDESITVLDPQVVGQAWRPPSQADIFGGSNRTATVSADDMTVTVTFTDGPPDWVDYPRVDVHETDTAVTIVALPHDRQTSGARTALGYRRNVTATLERPLGARVLVDLDVSPITARHPRS